MCNPIKLKEKKIIVKYRNIDTVGVVEEELIIDAVGELNYKSHHMLCIVEPVHEGVMIEKQNNCRYVSTTLIRHRADTISTGRRGDLQYY